MARPQPKFINHDAQPKRGLTQLIGGKLKRLRQNAPPCASRYLRQKLMNLMRLFILRPMGVCCLPNIDDDHMDSMKAADKPVKNKPMCSFRTTCLFIQGVVMIKELYAMISILQDLSSHMVLKTQRCAGGRCDCRRAIKPTPQLRKTKTLPITLNIPGIQCL